MKKGDWIVPLFKGEPNKIEKVNKDSVDISYFDSDVGMFKISSVTKDYIVEGKPYQMYKHLTKEQFNEQYSDSSLLYPNQGKKIISSSLTTINGEVSIINFYTNNAKYGTEEKLDDFDLDNLKECIIRFSQDNPRRALELLQEIYN